MSSGKDTIMANNLFPHLFSPIRLGDVVFRNRMFVAPTSPFDVTNEGWYTQDTVTYFARKAQGGVAAVCMAGHAFELDMEEAAYEKASAGYLNMTNALQQRGAVPVIELNHAGMFSKRPAEGPIYGPVECINSYGRHVLPYTEEMIEELIDQFALAAWRAKQVGFKMVLLHAGHGWLISQFISPYVNTRTDRWGGSLENRMRFPLAIAEAIRKKCGPGFPIEMRISGSERIENGYGIDEGIRIAQALDGKIDLIHVSAGNHEVPEAFFYTTPPMFYPEAPNLEFAAEIKKHVKTPVATVGAYTNPEIMEEVIATGKADVIYAARAFIADPYFAEKARTGHADDIDHCMRCLNCFSTHRPLGHFYCAINPSSGHETDLLYDRVPVTPQKVLVAGGGIAGMEAALVSARRGHKVILCEKTDRLGGILRCEESLPFKARLKEYLDRQIRRLEEAGVEIRLNTTVTPEYAAQADVDVVLAALGAVPVVPPIPGIGLPHVTGVVDAYQHISDIRQKVAIIGGGFAGCELALYLKTLGKNVTVFEARQEFDFSSNHLHGRVLRLEMNRAGVDIRLGAKVTKITENSVFAITENGQAEIEADTVVYATGLSPLFDEAESLRQAAPVFVKIGDCECPKNITNATQTAYMAAWNIGVNAW